MAEQGKKTERLWTGTFLLFILMYFGNVSCLYYYSGTMTLIGASLSDKVWVAGALSSIYSLTPLFLRPFVGAFVDRVGRWKSNNIGIIITMMTIVGYLFAGNIYLLFVLRGISGLAFCLTSIANYTSASDLIPETRKTEGLGWFQNAGTVSTYVGPALALYAIALTPGSYVGLHIGGLILCSIALITNLFLNYEKKPEYIAKREREMKAAEEAAKKELEEAKAAETPAASGKLLLGLPMATWMLVLTHLLVTCAHSTVNSYLLLSAQERGIDGISNFFLFMAAGMFVARGFLSKLADKLGLMKVFVPVLIVGGLCLGIFGISNNVWVLTIAAFPYGFLFGTSAAVCNSNIVKSAPVQKRAFASSMYLIAVDVGYGIFPILSGFIIQAVGYNSIFFIAAVLPWIAIIFVILYTVKQNKARKVCA